MVVTNERERLGRHLPRIRTGHEEARRRNRAQMIGLQMIAGDLEADELVIGQIVIERLNDEVAILEGAGAILVELVAAALGEANGVEPVAGPAFAEMRALQDTIDESIVGVWRV